MKIRLILLLGLLTATHCSLSAQDIIMPASGTFSQCTDNFYDSGGSAGNYGNSQNNTITICPSVAGQRTSLVFNSFNLENNFDFLEIYDGNSTAAPLIGTYTGTISPGTVSASTTNPSGCLTIVFTSDGSVTRFGWEATIQCLPPCQSIIPQLDSVSPAFSPSDSIIRICQGQQVDFFGSATFGTSGTGATYSWDFGDGSTANGQNVSNTYALGGDYLVQLNITDASGCTNFQRLDQRIYVSTTPIFNASGNPSTICLGNSSTLTANPMPTASDCTPPSSGTTFLPDGNGASYTTSIAVTCYNPSDVIASANDIDNICIDMEHSYLGDLNIEIVCPNGQSATLHQYPGGGATYLGNPIDPGPGPGTGSTYCFTPTATTLLVNGPTVPATNSPGNSIQAGSYQPVQSFANLVGCPVNGDWTIVITDNLTFDDGYIFSWDINFAPSLVPASTFTPTIVSQGWQANPDVNIIDSVTATATPTSVGSQCYTYSLTDDFGCVYDTVVCINVAPNPNSTITTTSASCGQNDGAVDLTPSGGTSPYTYQWDNGATSQDLSNVGAGTYNVTITDNNGCTSTNTAVVGSSGANISVSFSTTDASCGQSNGSATATPAGGTSPYNYSWDDPLNQTTATATGLLAGTYTVTIVDANTCSTTASVTVSESAAVSVTAAVTSDYNGSEISCNGSFDGELTATGSGGTGTITYVWDDPSTQATAVANGLAAGGYCVTATDANGCTATTCITITEPSAVTATANNTDVSCFGGNDGTATASGAGGTGATYTFQWDDGNNQTTATATGLAANTYNVTVADVNGCTDVTTVTVTQPATAVSVSATSTDALCFGSTDGTATATPAGGAGGYTYLWDANAAGQTTATAVGLLAGNYCVTVTDANGCTATTCVNVIDGTPITLTTNNTAVSCNGGSDGTATVTAVGGVGGFIYQWSASALSQITATATAVPAGTHGVTVTDANGCSVDTTVTVTEPTALTNVTFTATTISCNGLTDGTATVSVSGGTPAYTYLWDNGQNTQTGTGFPAGSHTVTITDANGCTITGAVIITEPSALSVTVVSDSVNCSGGSDGSATATATGGTTPYSYSWSNGANTFEITNQPAGSYTVTVTDANGCQVSQTVDIGQPASVLTVNVLSSTNPVCSGDTDGTITVDALGGTPGYTFAWDVGQFTATATGLAAGTYTVTATDARGCTASTTATLTTPAVLITNVTQFSNFNGSAISCPGATDGAAQVTASGGVPGYTYLWSGPVTQNTTIASGLAQGTYFVTVTDAAGCSAVDSITLTDPVPLQATETHTDVFCNGDCDGQIIVNAVSGTGTLGINGYEYRIVGPGQTGNVFSSNNNFLGLCAGTYTVEVRDGNNCVLPVSITLTEPPVLAASAIGTDASCNGAADGTATVTATGGVAPYSYSWPGGLSGNPVTGLAAGGYDVTVTDANGCDVVTSVVINEPTALTATVTFTEPSCNNGGNATATATPSGGTAPYSYFWSNGQNGQTAIGYTAGNHTVTISDANNCQIVRNVTITQPAALTVSITGTNLNCSGNGSGTATATPTGGTGPYTYQWSNGQSTQTATGLSQGVVSVIVRDANSCQILATTTLTQPNPLQVSLVSTTNATCNGAADGSATVTASGGSAPYSYNWSNGQAGATATGLTAGIYTASVTDNGGCTQTIQVNITEPNAISIDQINTTMVSCKGGSDGTASAFISGGTAPYTFSWTGGGNTQQLTGLTAGTYNLTLTDANGCSTTSTVIVNEPAQALTGVINTQGTLCSGGATGQLTAVISGGTLTSPDYNYQWSNGATTPVVSGVTAGTYSVTVTDDNGCTLSLSATVGSGGTIAINSLTNTDVTCEGGSDATANVAASGGAGTLVYNWSNGQAGTVATGLSAGTYYISITDDNGCTYVDSVTVQDGPEITINTNISDANCFGESSGTLTVTNAANFGSISWNDPQLQVGAQASNLAAGQYTVTVVTLAGCPATETYTVGQPDELVTNIEELSPVACRDDSTGSLRGTASGGTGAYSFSWSTGGNNATINNLPAGAYSLSITDANGCQEVESYSFGNPVALGLEASGTGVACVGDNDGNIQVSGVGGTARLGSYEFSIDSSNWQAGNLFPNLTSGVYTVYVRDNNGCVADTMVNIEAADPFFIISLLPGDTTIEYGDTIVLEADVNDPTGAVVNWIDVNAQDTIIDSTSTSAYIITQFPAERTIYRFVAVSPAGCVADTSMIVDVNKTRVVGAPSAFTPNLDGANDRFFIQANRKVTKVTTFRVYDRWGELVFENSNFQPNDPLEGWDGTFQGKPMNSAVFAWYAEVEFIDGHLELIRGEVTLLR